MNKVILIGRLGADPELRSTGSGKSVCNLRVATSDGSGERKETTWHAVIAWEKQAELCAKYLAKGRLIGVEGRIQVREYDDKDGNKRKAFEIVAHHVEFLDKGDARDSDGRGDDNVSF